MGAFSIWHIAIVGIIAMVLFGGRNKVSDLMGDLGKGINSFKAGLSAPDSEATSVAIDKSEASAPASTPTPSP